MEFARRMGYITKCPHCHRYHDSNMDCSSEDRLKKRAARKRELGRDGRPDEEPRKSAASVNPEDLVWCTRHRRHYHRNYGCQLCYLERSSSTVKKVFVASGTMELKRCPKCKKKALFWNSYSVLYECENKPDCGRVFTKGEIDSKWEPFRKMVKRHSRTRNE